jgi:sigma-B regulation protein RsbU (phosphoserine phosphatase)
MEPAKPGGQSYSQPGPWNCVVRVCFICFFAEASMEEQEIIGIRTQLLNRRERLQEFIREERKTPQLVKLLQDVDMALERLNDGTYGICEICREPIEPQYLRVEPLVRVCLGHLSDAQQRAIERDLELAAEVQVNLLPTRDTQIQGWQLGYHYEPVGPVSGDYCDVVASASSDDGTYFFFGDVSGKGVAASLLVSHLHAMFRSLVVSNLPLARLVERANRLFCESTMSSNFATLVCGKISQSGELEICNAGHCYPLVVKGGQIRSIESTGLPLGTFYNAEYQSRVMHLAEDDILFLYTDGLTEARNPSDEEYSEAQLSALVARESIRPVNDLIDSCVKDWQVFRAGAPKTDDLTIMVLRKSAS